MRTLDRQLLRDACWDAGLEPEEAVMEDYSGRAMYGETCLAIRCGHPARDAVLFLLALQPLAAEADPDHGDLLAQDLAQAMRTDDLGRGSVAYFPGFRVGA
jgi:hypothetical protein